MAKRLIKDRNEKKEVLKEYIQIELELELLKAQEEKIRENKLQIKQSISSIHSSRGNDITDYIIKLDDIQNKINKKIMYITMKLNKIEKAIYTLKNVQERNILRLRYIEGKSIKEIEQVMYQARRTLYNIENNALDNLKLYKNIQIEKECTQMHIKTC